MKLFFETQGTNTYLVYQFAETDKLDETSYNMISCNRIANISDLAFSQRDAERYLKYNISAKVSVREFFTGPVNRDRLLGVFSSIASALLAVDDYMLNPNSLLLDLDYIFVDVRTNEAVLICLPIIKPSEGSVDLANFFKDILYGLQFDSKENQDYITGIISFLNNTPVFSTEKFKKALLELQLGGEKKPVAAKTLPKPPVIQPPAMQKRAFAQQPPMQQVPAGPGVQAPFPPFLTDAQKPVKQEKKPSLLKRLLKPEQKEKKPKVKTAPPPKAARPSKHRKSAQPSFAIPGEGPPPVQAGPGLPGASQEGSVRVAASFTPQAAQPPPQKPTFVAPGLNFGETTVLGGQGTGETTVLNQSSPQVKHPYLVRGKNNEQILLDKPNYRIGKEKSYVDYFIGDNTAISRSHANIISRQGEYFIMDTNSTNHTFVNGVMLQANTEVKISSGDIIHLANEEFMFVLQ